MTPSRRALLAAGVATIAVSLVLSIAPVIAANGNGNGGNSGNDGGGGGNSGTIKIHDAATGLETLENDTDPHVCGFWVAFYASDPFEAGIWQLFSWPPTGDGSVVASGTYDTSGDGLDATTTLSPDPGGHFRFEWTAAGSNSAKHKTLWVDESCGTDEIPPVDDEIPPVDDEIPPVDDETPPSGDETPPSGDETPPSGDETPPSGDETPPSGDETPPSGDETPPSGDETPPSGDETPPSGDETPPSGDETPPSGDETPPSGDETPSLQDEIPPADDETPPSEDQTPPSEDETPPSQDENSGTPPSQDQEGETGLLPGNPNPPVIQNPAPEGAVAAAGATSTLPDTSIPLGSSGVLAAMGLLLIVAAHSGTRRRPLLG